VTELSKGKVLGGRRSGLSRHRTEANVLSQINRACNAGPAGSAMSFRSELVGLLDFKRGGQHLDRVWAWKGVDRSQSCSVPTLNRMRSETGTHPCRNGN